jgi:SAM-dependent methyltransferase
MSACPLCGASGARDVEQLTGDQLRALWRTLGWEFSAEAWGRVTPEFVVGLDRCVDCGFEFFDPSLAGNESFYRELEREDYFVQNRPEFQRTLSFARHKGLKKALDVGCGSGIFLDMARAAGCKTWGLELNRAAADKARSKGHQVLDCTLDDVSKEQVGELMDLVTFFQVLEHVAEPAQVLRKAASLLKPGGCIAVAVPAAEGVLRLVPWDPHQWPPHHITRWRLKDFGKLARVAGVSLLESGGDQLLGSDIFYFWKLRQRLASVMGQPGKGAASLARLVSLLYRKTGMKWFFPRRGISIYAFFQLHPASGGT